MTALVPSFGEKLPGERYIERPSAYVILEDSMGRIATVQTPEGVYLPGGGLERDESAQEAAVREAAEEAGLEVRIVRDIGRADQYLFSESEGAYFAKRGRYFTAFVVGTCTAREADHELVWLSLEQALSAMTHGSHRWALEVSHPIVSRPARINGRDRVPGERA